MLNLLMTILVLAIVFGLVWWIITLIPLPPPFTQVAQIVLALIFILVLLGSIFGGVNLPRFGN